MARYLLESSATDGYLLEDGSGVLLLEEPPAFTFFGDMSNQPTQPRKLRTLKVAVLATIGIASPVLVPPPPIAIAASSHMDMQRSIQYQALAFIPDFGAAPAEDITLDKWYQPEPHVPRRLTTPQGGLGQVLEPLLSLDWLPNGPQAQVQRLRPRQPDGLVRPDPVAPEVITLDKWLTDSPIGPSWPKDHSLVFLALDVLPIPNPPPPEPPEPEPEPPRRFKPMHVSVRHVSRPPGGFNTIYYVDDPDEPK